MTALGLERREREGLASRSMSERGSTRRPSPGARRRWSPPSRSSRSRCSAAAASLHGQGGLRQRRPARAGQPGAGGRPAGRHDHRHRAGRPARNAVVTMKVDDDCRAAPRGHDGHDPRHLAVRHREPLRLAQARAEQRATKIARRRADRRGRDQRAGGPRRALQHARRQDARGASSNFIRGSGDRYDARGAEAGQSTKYFAPFLGSTSRPDHASWRSTRRCSTRFVKDGADDGLRDRRAPRRPRRTW